MSKKTLTLLITLAALVVGVPIVLVLVSVVVFAPFRIPSAGMYPSLEVEAHIWVNKLAKKPEYGAVMVFRYPDNPQQDFAKRVVALPGDRVETHGTELFINGWLVPHCTVGKHSYADDTPSTHKGTLEVEWLGDETYLVFHDEVSLASDYGPYTVPTGEYFVLGDNRENSHDSRMWRGGLGGGVPDDNTVGRVRVGKIALPRGAESLKAALDACLAKRPSKTRP